MAKLRGLRVDAPVLLLLLASTHSTPLSCAPASSFLNGTCLPNPSAHLGPKYSSCASASACCASCAAAGAACQSWSWWGGNKCALFSTVGVPKTVAGCVSGAMHSPPAPAPSPPIPSPRPYPDRTPAGAPCTDCPNIIWALTDDQDVTLGGWDPMRHTQQLIQSRGISISEYRVHTPICSPSRSELISGRYFHNIKSSVAVPPPSVLPAATAHVNGSLYAGQSLGEHLRQRAGYRVAIFGKANFNTYAGFDRWFQGAIDGYGGRWEDDESVSGFYDANKTEYATALIGNKTVEWLRRDEVTGPASAGRPFFLYFAPHAPHAPATPARWYDDACAGTVAPRQPNFNWSTPLFHDGVATQPPLSTADARLVDLLARSRCQSLLSVDDAYAAIYRATVERGVANNTYWFISSDHGYNLGSHRLTSNKMLLYEHSIRAPLVVQGPGVPAGGEALPLFATNVDLAPTWLALAGIAAPPTMDGRSFLPWIVSRAPDKRAELMPATRRGLLLPRRKRRASARAAGRTINGTSPAIAPSTFRTEQFVQYYSPGPWSPPLGGDTCPACVASGLNATPRMICSQSRTYIGLHIKELAQGGLGHYKYGEYQTNCTSEQMLSMTCFDNITAYELFDLQADPWERYNVVHSAPVALLAELRHRLRQYYPCQGHACP